MKTETVRLVVFGLGGDTVYYAGTAGCSSKSSGYGSPENPHAADFAADRKAGVLVPDGTPCINLRVDGCDVMYAVRGPMVDVDLADGEVDRLPVGRSMVTAAMDVGFGGMLSAHDRAISKRPSKLGPLDSVSVPEHVAAWREHGAQIGRYVDRVAVWEG